MIRILYDYQIFSFQKVGGISRYFFELIKRISVDKDFNSMLSVIISNNIYLKQYKLANFFDFPKKDFKGKAKLMNCINKINSIIDVKSKQYDILHPTYYDPYFLKYLNYKPFVLTVYDMIHEKFKHLFPNRDKTSLYKRKLCMKASKIIAISGNTKKDLIEIFGINESKISVIHLGSSLGKSFKKEKINIKLPEKYILFVGNRKGYKNFNNFVKAYSILSKQYKDIDLLCVGGGRFNFGELKFFEELNIKERVHHLQVSDEFLSLIYENALMFVFPSLYEGFGIPLLEAFSCDCPVICSNASSFPEIAKNAALYFDPINIQEIFNAMIKILTDSKLRKQLIIKGRERSKCFSWDKTAEKTKEIYRQVLM